MDGLPHDKPDGKDSTGVGRHCGTGVHWLGEALGLESCKAAGKPTHRNSLAVTWRVLPSSTPVSWPSWRHHS